MDSQPLIVSDSSPLIALALLGLLEELSQLAEDIFIPKTVYQECTCNLSLPGAKAIKQAVDAGLLYVHKDLILSESPVLSSIADLVDAGEAQAIAISQNISGLLLIDDKAGRRCAKHLNIPVVGSIGVLLQMQNIGLVDNIEPMIKRLQDHGYRYSETLIAKAILKSRSL